MDEETEVEELTLEEAAPEQPEERESPKKAPEKRAPSPALPMLRTGLVSLVAAAFLVLSAVCAVEAVRSAIEDPGDLGTLQRADPAAIAAEAATRAGATQNAPVEAQEPAQSEPIAPIEPSDSTDGEAQGNPSGSEETEVPLDTPVWISTTGETYHARDDCENLDSNDASQIPLSEALSQGLTQCENCW